LIRPLLPALIAEAGRRGNPQEAYEIAQEALIVLQELHRALVPNWTPGKFPLYRPMRIHASRDEVQEEERQYGGGLDKDRLEAAAASYLSRPWMVHDYLDWCLVDAMIRREWAAFVYEVQHPPSDLLTLGGSNLGWMRWKGLPWLIEGAIGAAIIWWLRRSYTNDDPYFVWWAVGATTYYGYCTIAYVRRAKAIRTARRLHGDIVDYIINPKLASARLLVKMQQCYRELAGPVLNPTRVRDELRSGEAMGIGWPNSIWPILESAIARNPAVWNVSGEEWCA
jgi:hypothetical protein